jgi:soluble lytic murein transglycosylase-like protein
MTDTSIPESVAKWEPLIKGAIPYPEISIDLVLALIWQESAGDPWAIRHEYAYQYFFNHKDNYALYDKNQSVSGNRIKAQTILGLTEFFAQSTSWGLLQIMGAAARERGFKARYLSELCDPEVNLMFGIKHLHEWGFNYGKLDLQPALTRWNGSAQYAGEVIEKLGLVQV